MSNVVEVNLRFFAGIREQLNCAQQSVELPAGIETVGQVRDWLIARGGIWASALAGDKPLRMAYQQVMCEASEPLVDAGQPQEIAFFPPVTGG
jgi:molybdopterin synthase sulfur carrier subunit